jgi:hypothetical protein
MNQNRDLRLYNCLWRKYTVHCTPLLSWNQLTGILCYTEISAIGFQIHCLYWSWFLYMHMNDLAQPMAMSSDYLLWLLFSNYWPINRYLWVWYVVYVLALIQSSRPCRAERYFHGRWEICNCLWADN